MRPILIMHRLKPKALLLLSFVFVVNGCQSSFYRNLEAESNSQWQVKGKFQYSSVQTQTTPSTKLSGSFIWQQRGADYKVSLFGPLGLGTVKISGNSNSIQVKHKGQIHQSEQPQQLLKASTGLDLPITSISRWLLGEPNKRNTSINKTETGLSFVEYGWVVDTAFAPVDELQMGTQSKHRPKQIIFKPAGSDERQEKMRLIIKQWQFFDE